jgi:D-beta-D-heptose 7-phosphate kinase/D-beta-D-heptose 1-phosphate adenosyltransferase
MCLIDPQDGCYFTSVHKRKVFDVSGAGDTAIAYLAAAYASGMKMEDAAELANTAAGIKVSKVGTAPVYRYEVERALSAIDTKSSGKIIRIEDMEQLRVRYQEKTVVFTNGCFDILHRGHIDYLRQAATLGDFLIVGVNSDDSVRRLKGSARPINELSDRLEILAALEYVTYVIAFEEDTPERLIKQVKPSVLVKGGDYSKEQIVGWSFVESYGGLVTTVPLTNGKSTTNIINHLEKDRSSKG